MNRFRTKKRAKDDSAPRPSHDSDSPAPFRLFGKSKKTPEEEPKKEIDIAAALPSNDDFRTSLLMTGLSARFSMLKEQDDPSTKIGKASDDSVLFPKRGSRLDLGFGLGDIAEVESIRTKAPFARDGRVDSFHSSDDSISGSMMDRAKPTEGNNLFGGRQKIYKISASGSSKNIEGHMGGRALYENDVAQSSFQRWRQGEKTQALEEGQDDQLSLGLDIPRSESPPPLGYNRRRETNSTTSSAPSAARNSTAATSITSASAKDWQPGATPNLTQSASGTPLPERTVTRTRRLYETGLMNDLQETQSSALSRMDTLSRTRNFGTRTPDLSGAPSPTSNLFTERFGDRKIMNKASAPSLRSASPTMTNSPSFGTMDLGIRVPSGGNEPKGSYPASGAPPLSPPISESEETSPLPIGPNDRGKATALGIFQKPSQGYDEARYAQKQLQLQQGRETPTNRFRPESSTSRTTSVRSHSSSSTQRQPLERADSSLPTEPTVQEETNGIVPPASTAAASEEAPRRIPFNRTDTSSSFHSDRQRPSDHEHPALREPSLPTPMSYSSRMSDDPSPPVEKPDLLAASNQSSPQDSPTLGPTSGLSGIVRQHLRSDSDASSVYGLPTTDPTARASNAPYNEYASRDLTEIDVPSNPWDSQPEWRAVVDGHEDQLDNKLNAIKEYREESGRASPAVTPQLNSTAAPEVEKDEFARHLADGARRVRERLTSYVESDSRSVSPQPPEIRETPPSRPNALNLLKAKSSRGSLIDRNRNRDPERERGLDRDNNQSTKAMKMLGIGAATMSTSPTPTPSKRSFELDREPLASMNEEPEPEPAPVRSPAVSPPRETQEPEQQPAEPEAEDREIEEEKNESMHAGLRAFRQARRELQKLKEAETKQRRQPSTRSGEQQPGDDAPYPNARQVSPTAPTHAPPMPPVAQSPSARERPLAHRSPSREHRPPPTSMNYQQRAPSEESKRSGSRPPSRTTERDRSGSENSTGSRSRSRPPMLRNVGGPPYDGPVPHHGPPRPMGRSPGLPPPGLPGTDIRRSPIMPSPGYHPQGSHGPPSGPLPGPPQGQFDRSASGNLRAQPWGREQGYPSPMSPMSPMPSPYMGHSGANTPMRTASPRRPSAPPTPNMELNGNGNGNGPYRADDAMRRTVRKRDISEPTFVSSTSRVPTVAIGEDQSRSRSNSILSSSTASTPNLPTRGEGPGGHAPPLPPINPRRRNIPGMGQRMSEDQDQGLGLDLPPHKGIPVPGEADRNSAFSISDEEDVPMRERRRLRKATSEANGMNVKARQAQFGGAVRATPPPMPMPGKAANAATRLPGGMI